MFRGGPFPDPLKPDTGLREAGASPVVPIPMLEGREVAVTDTLLRKILGHPEKPREQLPGQPVRPLAEISQAGTRYCGEEGGGDMGLAHQIPDAVGAKGQAKGLQGVPTWDAEAGHRGGGSWGKGQAPVSGGQVSWQSRNFKCLTLPSLTGQW